MPETHTSSRMPHARCRVPCGGSGLTNGYDADLAAESTRLANRLHDALLHIHSALERLLGKHSGSGVAT
jgi:hypothetical protein